MKNFLKKNEAKVKKANELFYANKKIAVKVEKKDKSSKELIEDLLAADKELAYQKEEKADRAAELVIANKELKFQTEEKADRASELVIANKELDFQTGEKADRAAELVIANKELKFQTEEKADRASELVIANKELKFQTGEKADRASELVIANKELKFQTGEKADRASELKKIQNKILFQRKEILYLKNYDELTGLYNRKFYEEELKRLDKKSNLPLTIAVGNINGLKMINDSFGHEMGDVLIKRIAENISKACRKNDIVARLGGDEFVIIMPKTDTIEADKVINKIYSIGSNEKKSKVIVSISFGYETKRSEEEKTFEIYRKAEDYMYEHKTYESSSSKNKIVEVIMNTLYEKSNRELLHSKRVGELCERIATKMGFEKDDINQMKITGLMHDIGKIGIDEKILNKNSKLNMDEWNEIKKHPEIGYRILSSSNDFSNISDYVLEHQEYYNGKGYPKGLKGEEISIQARILSVADSFDAMTVSRTYGKALSEKDAINEIERCSGTQFDPEVVKVFSEEVMEV